jgi:hypothetical protein
VGMRRVPKADGQSQGEPGGHGVCISTRSAPGYQPSQAHSVGAQVKRAVPCPPPHTRKGPTSQFRRVQGVSSTPPRHPHDPWLHRRRLRPPPCPANAGWMWGVVGCRVGLWGCVVVVSGFGKRACVYVGAGWCGGREVCSGALGGLEPRAALEPGFAWWRYGLAVEGREAGRVRGGHGDLLDTRLGWCL